MQNKTIIIAGATGALGSKIAHYLLEKGVKVWALVRKGSTNTIIATLRKQGVEIVEVDFNNIDEIAQACMGEDCLVSAVSRLRKVIVDVQTNLVKAAVAAKVPRFIPSDFGLDFTKNSALIPYSKLAFVPFSHNF